MFKTAATKIAHNSTIPALGGNQDLRPLQDLITAEKAVLISLQKLSVDYSKASEALRTWGLSEGDDLGDILSASTSILNHFSSALSQYAVHGHSMRDQLKAIRTREEYLDDLKRRRRTVLRKAEDAERKLSKMGSEHKNLAMQTETLHRLRDDIRTMDSDIMLEEAALGDFKRSATRMWMGLKFSGLLECCEKGTIAGEYGKLTISEISEEMTQPGLPRSLYYGHSKVEGLVAEAHRCVNEVTLSTVQSIGFRDRRLYEQKSSNAPLAAFNSPTIGYGEPPNNGTWSSDVKSQPPPPPTLQDDSPSHLQAPTRPFVGNDYLPEKFNSSNLNPTTSSGNQPYAPPYQLELSHGTTNSSFSQTLPSSQQQLGANEGAVDDFGVNVRPAGSVDILNTPGGRFATFPVKSRPPGSAGGYSSQDPPSLGGRHFVGDSSFSASIAEALHEKEDLQAETLSPWSSSRFNDGSETSSRSEGTTRATEGSHNHPTNSWGGRFDGDPPPFEGLPPLSTMVPSSQIPLDNSRRSSGQSGSLPMRPPGAAPPELSNPWINPLRKESSQASSHSRQSSHLSENDYNLLAYNRESPPNTAIPFSVPSAPTIATTTTTTLSSSTTNEEDQNSSRHVRFGAVEDVDEEIEKRVSLEKEQVANTHGFVTSRSSLSDGQHSTTSPDKSSGDGFGDGETNSVENRSVRQQAKPSSRRVPPPAIEPIEEDEKALNAAAAHEIGLELEALKNNNQNQLPPVPSQVDQRSQPDPMPDFDRGQPVTMSTSRFNDYPGPPTVPMADGARDASPMAAPLERNLPPHPYAELNPPGAYSPYATSQPYVQQSYQPPPVSPAQAYAQSYQQQQQQPQAPDMRNTLPPRFQSLNNNKPMESQVPPRFQSSSSPIINSLPPRFQTSYTPPVSAPGGVSTPDQQQRDDVISPANPRTLASTAPFTKSNTSLPIRNPPMPLQVRGSTPPSTGNTGVRTINAAAFKRPTPRNPGSIDSDTMMGKKMYIAGGGGASASSPGGGQPLQQHHGKPVPEMDDDFDYITAYVNHNGPPSPRVDSAGPGQGRI